MGKTPNIKIWQYRYTCTWWVILLISIRACDSVSFIAPTLQPTLLTIRGTFYTGLHDVSVVVSAPAFTIMLVITYTHFIVPFLIIVSMTWICNTSFTSYYYYYYYYGFCCTSRQKIKSLKTIKTFNKTTTTDQLTNQPT